MKIHMWKRLVSQGTKYTYPWFNLHFHIFFHYMKHNLSGGKVSLNKLSQNFHMIKYLVSRPYWFFAMTY